MNCLPHRIWISALFLGGAWVTASAQEATPAPPPAKTFTHIPLEDRDVLEALVQSAVADFQVEKYDSALKKLDEADEKQPNSPMILNLIGAIYTKQQKYDEAEKSFLDTLALDPNFFPAKFNLGEIKFLRKDYADALRYFETMRLDHPREELLDFKIVLSQLMMDQRDAASKAIDKMPFPGNSPAWYYANAAYHLKIGEKSEGMKYVHTARKIFAAQTGIYDEGLRDAGLLSKSS